MPEVHDHQNEQFYDGDRRMFSVTVDIDAEVYRGHTDEAVDVVERLRMAVREESQAIQDEFDEGDEDAD